MTGRQRDWILACRTVTDYIQLAWFGEGREIGELLVAMLNERGQWQWTRCCSGEGGEAVLMGVDVDVEGGGGG